VKIILARDDWATITLKQLPRSIQRRALCARKVVVVARHGYGRRVLKRFNTMAGGAR
jgi:hypothetical protein